MIRNKEERKKLLHRLRKKNNMSKQAIKSPQIQIPIKPYKISKEEMEKAEKKLIQEGKDAIFNMSFENQRWEHMWNLEEYEKNRIELYENEFPRDESYEGVAQWCICYQCRPKWHSEPGGSIYKAKERNKESLENYRMNKEDSNREKKRLKLKEENLKNKKIAKRNAREERKRLEKEELEKKKKEELKKKFELQEMEYREYLIKEKDKEVENLIKEDGWKRYISKDNKIYWHKNGETKWSHQINIKYNEWLEFYSYKNDKQFWYNHKTKEKTWKNPNLNN